MKKNDINKGFTLIELVIVLSIIAILASISVPQYSYYIEKAKKTKAITIGRQIYMSSMSSFSEEDGNFNRDRLLETIRSTVSAVNISSSQVNIITPKLITIDYLLDSKNYKLQINADMNNFTIESGGIAILNSN